MDDQPRSTGIEGPRIKCINCATSYPPFTIDRLLLLFVTLHFHLLHFSTFSPPSSQHDLLLTPREQTQHLSDPLRNSQSFDRSRCWNSLAGRNFWYFLDGLPPWVGCPRTICLASETRFALYWTLPSWDCCFDRQHHPESYWKRFLHSLGDSSSL